MKKKSFFTIAFVGLAFLLASCAVAASSSSASLSSETSLSSEASSASTSVASSGTSSTTSTTTSVASSASTTSSSSSLTASSSSSASSSVASSSSSSVSSSSSSSSALRVFTLTELAQYNGDNGGLAYIAVNWVVYDVTNAPKWTNGWHKGMHLAGTDCTAAFLDQHSLSYLAGLPIVGTLAH